MSDTPLPFWIDQKYEAVRLLGKGGGGQAFLAKKGNQPVAIKLLNPGFGKDPDRVIQKFKKEFLTLKKLNHPHIGRLHDFGFDPQIRQYYFAGEFIEGEDIRKACTKLPLKKIEELFVQALQALHYLHTYSRAGLRHNDIKAANILVTQNKNGPHLKLIDFGLANLAPLDVRGGTASYMAPEQIALTFPEMAGPQKFPKPDPRADLYSLGVLWYLCITGINPFLVERDSDATLKKHFGPLPPPPSTHRKEIPAWLDKIILRLLNTNPKDRYSSAAEVIHDLAFLSGKPYAVIPGNQRGYYLPEGELIGHQEAWQTLKEKWNGLLQESRPTPQVIWVLGEHGLGKTKLLEHFKNRVQSEEGKFLFLRQSNPESLEEWFSEVDRLFKNPKQPAVIAVDDFGDEHPAQKYLTHVWRWHFSEPPPWLFVFTADKASETTRDFGSESIVLSLHPLTEEELKDWIQKISPHKGSEIPESFIRQLKNHTGGNPMRVSSVLTALAARGLLWDDDGAWHPILFRQVGIDFKKLPTPQNMQGSLKKQWRELKKDQKKRLAYLACFEGGFENSFFQRMIYEQLSSKERRQHHDAIAQELKQQKEPAHKIAWHLARGSKKQERIAGLKTLVDFYEQRGNVEEAVNTCQALAEEFSKKDFKQKLPVVLRAAGILNRHRLSDGALALCETWLKNIGKTKNSWRTALLREKGIAFLNAQKWTEARECFEQALDKTGDLFLQNSIAATWLGARKLNKAIVIYSETRETAKKLKSSQQLEILNNDLGHAFFLAQQPEKALPCFEEDLKLFEGAKDKTRSLRTHFLIGNLFRRQLRDFNAAIKHYQAAAELAKDTKDNDWLMRIYNGLAGTYLDRAHADTGAKSQNHYAQALSFFEESLALCQYMKRQSHLLDFETAAILLNIGTVHREMENFARGRDTFQTILKVFESKPIKSPQEFERLCETYIALADCLSAEQKFTEMEEPLRRAWKIAKDSRELLEHRLAIQLLWAEVAKAKKDTGELRKHLDQIDHLQTKYKINPTPMAKKRIEGLRRV